MKLKTFFILLTFQVASTVYLYINYSDYFYIPITVMILIAILSDYFLLKLKLKLKLKRERASTQMINNQSKNLELNKDENGEEYHNDFSKVPGGEYDGNQPMPINYLVPDLYHELERSQDEDLKKAGLIKDQKVNTKKSNKLDV